MAPVVTARSPLGVGGLGFWPIRPNQRRFGMSRDTLCGRLAALALLSLLVASPAAAADKELLDVLLSNGAITQAQYDELLQKEKLRESDLRDVLVSLDAKGLNIRRKDGAFSFNFGGRLHTDASGHFGSDVSDFATNGTEIRRARMHFKGTVYEDYLFQFEADFADNDVAVKDFLVGYSGIPNTTVLLGHQKQPFSLALEMSSNDIPFIERGADTDLVAFFVDRAIGLRAESFGDHWHVAGGVYGDSLEPDRIGNEGWGSTIRGVWAPIRSEDKVLHLGLRGAFRDPNDSRVRIRSETTHLSNLFLANTSFVGNVDRVFLTGPEAAFAFGPFSVGGEYNRVFLDRSSGGNLNFDGWHVEATWSLTGESRASIYKMKSGEFKGIKPNRSFSLRNGGRGAWELAARYAAIDLDDREVDGGRHGTLTLALNWYLNPAMRLMLNYSRVLDANFPLGDAEGLNVIQSRFDFHF